MAGVVTLIVNVNNNINNNNNNLNRISLNTNNANNANANVNNNAANIVIAMPGRWDFLILIFRIREIFINVRFFYS